MTVLCTHKACDIIQVPHVHPFISGHCKRGKWHGGCRGFHVSQQPSVITDLRVMLERDKQVCRMTAQMDHHSTEYFRITERMRREWDAYIELRDGKRKVNPPAPKVWTCTCECHPLTPTPRFILWSFLQLPNHTLGVRTFPLVAVAGSSLNGSVSPT